MRTPSGLDIVEEFPMYTLPLSAFLDLVELSAHEDMIDAKRLSIFDESMGKVYFTPVAGESTP